MYHHGIRLLYSVHLLFVNINTVRQQRGWTKDTKLIQPFHNFHAVSLQAVLQIIGSLRHMNMVSHSLRQFCGTPLHGLIRNRKGSMHSHHACDHITVIFLGVTDKPDILPYRCKRFLPAVTVGHLITKAGTDAQIPCRLLNRRQTAIDLTKAGMVIKYRRHTISYGIQISGIGGKLRLLQRQMTVNIPPHAIQNIQKAPGMVSVDRQAPGKSAVNVFMGINKSRHDNISVRV